MPIAAKAAITPTSNAVRSCRLLMGLVSLSRASALLSLSDSIADVPGPPTGAESTRHADPMAGCSAARGELLPDYVRYVDQYLEPLYHTNFLET